MGFVLARFRGTPVLGDRKRRNDLVQTMEIGNIDRKCIVMAGNGGDEFMLLT